MNINNNPYQQQMNSYMPQYPAYQYNQMGNMQQRYQPQQEFQMQSGLFGKVVQDAENIITLFALFQMESNIIVT